jgi:plasmid stabilization system protein ParE
MAKAKTPYRIVWRPMAEADLDNIIDYIARDSPTLAEAFGQELRERILPLAQHPRLGRTGRPGLPASVRELVAHRNYIIFTACWMNRVPWKFCE